VVRNDVQSLLNAAHNATEFGRARRHIQDTMPPGVIGLPRTLDGLMAAMEYLIAVSDALEASVERIAEAVETGSR
jgi:hypothetical protein